MSDQKAMRWSGIGVFVAALAYFGCNLPGFAYPNEWSSALYSILGLDPFRPLSRPVWQLIMSVLR